MDGLLHAMAFMMLLLIGWVIWSDKPLTIDNHTCLYVRIFSVPVVSILPICHKRLNEGLQLNAFAIDYCDLKIKVCYSCLQHYGTAQAMRLNCSNLKILPDCIVMNGIKKYCYIALASSINCVTFLVQQNLSNSSIYSIRYFFVGPDRIPIFCVHFCSSIYSFRHLFLALRRVLFG